MTLRDFIEAHPNEAFDIMTPEGRAMLEPRQAEKLLEGKAVIVCANGPKKASYADAEELLGYYVCSAYPTRSLWRLTVSYDPIERQNARFSDFMKRRISL